MNRRATFILVASGASLVLFVLFNRTSGRYFFPCWLAGIALLPVAAVLYLLLKDFSERAGFRYRVLQGVFFFQLGNQLLQALVSADPQADKLREAFGREELEAAGAGRAENFSIQISEVDLEILKVLLHQNRDLVLKLLLNETAWRNSSFGALLLNILYLCKELEGREDLSNISEQEYRHLQDNISRVYRLLIQQWVEQMRFWKKNYPYLFEAELRNSPFSSASAQELSD